MNAIILSGGFGTRLRPLTLSQPKAVLPVLNKPFCLYPLEWLSKHGVRDVVFATGYRSDNLATVLKKDKPHGVVVRCKVERKPLGTGGALRQAAGRSKERCVALNGDILTDFNLGRMLDFHLQRKAILTLALIRVPDVSRFGSVSLDPKGRIQRFIEKRPGRAAGLVSAGIYIFEPEALRQIPFTIPCSLERDLFPRLAQERRGIYGYPIRGYWNDVGTFASYLQAHRDLLKSSPRPVRVGHGTRLGKGVQLDSMVCIGRNCRIGQGAIIKDSVILDNVRIGEETRVTGSILSHRCRIGDHAELREGTVLGENTVVPEFNRC
jgi:NDP-sugar pyrophosphorylase family protein